MPPVTQQTQSISQTAQTWPSDKKAAPRQVGMAHVAVGLLGLAMLVSPCFKGPTTRIAGETCVVKKTNEDFKTFAFSSEDEYLKMLSSLRISDGEGILMQGVYGGMIGLMPQTRVRILAFHPQSGTYEVRVLEGEYYGQVVWMPSNSIE